MNSKAAATYTEINDSCCAINHMYCTTIVQYNLLRLHCSVTTFIGMSLSHTCARTHTHTHTLHMCEQLTEVQTNLCRGEQWSCERALEKLHFQSSTPVSWWSARAEECRVDRTAQMPCSLPAYEDITKQYTSYTALWNMDCPSTHTHNRCEVGGCKPPLAVWVLARPRGPVFCWGRLNSSCTSTAGREEG